jgi:hypothetical protein
MKTVVSVSLGSSRRDHAAVLTILGEDVQLARRGMDGSIERALDTIHALDGHVDALGLGGVDRWLTVGPRRYTVPTGERLAQAATATPVVDGTGIKSVWEPMVVQRLAADGILQAGQTALMVSALDRYPMAAALDAAGLHLVCGDLMFSARINYPIRTLAELQELGDRLVPEMVKLPFQQLYPVGGDQDAVPDPRFVSHFEEADVVAGDFHFIRRYLPGRLDGKVVLTTTTTTTDVDLLWSRGLSIMATTSPQLDGRTFGTNVLEAALVAASGVQAPDPRWDDIVRAAGLAPFVRRRPAREHA